MKKLNITLLLLLLTTITFARGVNAAPPIKGVGVVVKKNPGSSASKVVTTNNDGEVAIKITQAGDYTFTYPMPELLSKDENIKLGLCNNKVGLVDNYYSPNTKGEIEVKNLKPGVYAIKLINSPLGVCPEAYKLKDGICVVETTLVNGKQIYVGCEGGKMYCLERYIGNDGIGRTTGADAADCPQGGQSCTGNWLHERCRIAFDNPHIIDGEGVKEASAQVNSTTVKNLSATSTTETGGVNLTAESQHPHKLDLIIGAGFLTPNTELKENAYLQNMTSATLGIRMSVLDKNWWDLGIKLKGTYLTGNKEPTLPQHYNVEGQTSATVALKVDGSPRQSGFIAEVGPELDIHVIKGLILSVGVNVGYASLTSKAFSVTETIDYNATLSNYNLLTVNEVKLSGISVTPSINLKYKFGRVTVWSAIDRISFPKVSVKENSFSPNGTPLQNGEYLITQMQTGTNKNFEKTLSGSAIGVSGGLTIDLGRKSNYIGHVTLLR